MKKFLLSLLLTGAFTTAPMSAAPPAYYSFSPHECTNSETSAVGSGKNAFMEAAIRIDPAVDPLVSNLKGHNILGVRCYLRADYKQKSKGFSCIKAYLGSLEDEVASKTTNFTAGWNEVYFDEPIEISDTPIYVGYRVFETQGEPYPIGTYRDAEVPGVFFINPGREGWVEEPTHGAFLIEAIVDCDDSVLGNHVVAAPFKQPLVVAPNADFECSLYVHNQSAVPVKSIVYSGFDEDGVLTGNSVLELQEPLEPYGAITVSGVMRTPSTEGSAVSLTTKVTEINGDKNVDCMASSIELYISSDVFWRVPLIEEFTGLRCTNCPFMFYYLDMALESFAYPHVYVAHHAGYIPDTFTKPCDESLLYLFGSAGSYNPAVMYDRRVMQGCYIPIMGAGNEASTVNYDTRLAEAMLHPALAKVLVDSEVTTDKATCRVHGKISKAALDFKDNLYLTAYLLEDNIPATGRYMQAGMDNIPDDAPADLQERFRHRGVIRHCFSLGDNGDLMTINDDGSFDISFNDITPGSDWKIENCEVVAFVHKVNTEDLSDNYVLNAGATRFNDYSQTSVESIADSDGIRISVTPTGRIVASDPMASLRIYTLSGAECNSSSELSKGIYVVSWQCPDNTSGVKKVVVR